MSLSKRAVLTTGAALLLGLSTVAMAQTTQPAKGKKSAQVATMGEGEAVMIGPKGQRLHKSNVKITAAQHEAALKKGRQGNQTRRRHLQTGWKALHDRGQRQRKGFSGLSGQFRR